MIEEGGGDAKTVRDFVKVEGCNDAEHAARVGAHMKNMKVPDRAVMQVAMSIAGGDGGERDVAAHAEEAVPDGGCSRLQGAAPPGANERKLRERLGKAKARARERARKASNFARAAASPVAQAIGVAQAVSLGWEPATLCDRQPGGWLPSKDGPLSHP